MEMQDREHIATLCALSTLGASATGLAFGFREDVAVPTATSAKRKAPGDLSAPDISNDSRRSNGFRRIVSQPLPSTSSTEASRDTEIKRSSSRSLFRRRTLLNPEQASSNASTSTISRGGSTSHHRRLWSKSGDVAGEGIESANGSASWLRRISMMSSFNGNPAPSRPETPLVSLSSTSATPRFAKRPKSSSVFSNKLVMRSSSRGGLLSDASATTSSLCPTTSLQPPGALRQLTMREISHAEQTGKGHIWRPYFDVRNRNTGTMQPRKRHTSGFTYEQGARTLSESKGQQPTLILGTAVASRLEADELDDLTVRHALDPPPVTRRKHRLSKRERRVITEPVIRPPPTSSLYFERSRSSPLSPVSRVSAFDVDIPSGTPAFSDPTTESSDRVFTDDDSMDFQSDTAYDSLATRATVSSHSALRGLQIDAIFDDNAPSGAGNTLVGLEELIEAGSLSKRQKTWRRNTSLQENRSMISDDLCVRKRSAVSFGAAATPPQVDLEEEEDDTRTPMQNKISPRQTDFDSSPPSVITPRRFDDNASQNHGHCIGGLSVAKGLADWDDQDDDSGFDETPLLPELPGRNGWDFNYDMQMDSDGDQQVDTLNSKSENKPSIFDWSEHQKFGTDSLNGPGPRPKTVHGKQVIDGRGGRATGRRGPSAVHLRSQSVPVAKDLTHDIEPPNSAAKFGTWALGSKGVSEEWSDDFEFDDHDELGGNQPAGLAAIENGSTRGMKVPQAIIDRQASVHGQYGQVQEFMLLVEELKRLRLQGSALQILDSQSKRLWEDAESIINLATLNDDEEDLQRPQSPVSPGSLDGFEDDCATPSWPKQQYVTKPADPKSRTSTSRRSISSPATPPVNRPRGESLAQARSFLQNIHQHRNGSDTDPAEAEIQRQRKLPFDTQDLRDLVTRTGAITRALKDIVRKAEGVAISPSKSPKSLHDPSFSQIFRPPDRPSSPSPKKPGLPKSRSANGYLGGVANGNENDLSGHMKLLAVV